MLINTPYSFTRIVLWDILRHIICAALFLSKSDDDDIIEKTLLHKASMASCSALFVDREISLARRRSIDTIRLPPRSRRYLGKSPHFHQRPFLPSFPPRDVSASQAQALTLPPRSTLHAPCTKTFVLPLPTYQLTKEQMKYQQAHADLDHATIVRLLHKI